jgi:catechol 2,3-dioxygenase-like lactoylglutathione lyase family enzyme
MRITQEQTWVLAPTRQFDQSVAFWRDVLGLVVVQEGNPVTDTQFARFAQVQMPGGGVLEIVEPMDAVADVYVAPIVSISVNDLLLARREMEAQHVEFLTPIFDSRQGSGWTYFRGPDGNVYQLAGAYAEEDQ